MDPDTDPGGPKTYGSGFGSATLPKRVAFSHHQAFTRTCGGEEARLYVLQLVKIVQRAQVARIKVGEPASPCRLLAHLPHRRGGGLGAAAVGGNVVALEGGEGAGGGLSVREEGLQSHLLHGLQDAQTSTFRLQPPLLPAQTNGKNSFYIIIPTLSVGDPDPEPQDPHVFVPPRSGSISQRCGSGSGSGTFPFLINVLSGLK
jgi:hypothetical protein